MGRAPARSLGVLRGGLEGIRADGQVQSNVEKKKEKN